MVDLSCSVSSPAGATSPATCGLASPSVAAASGSDQLTVATTSTTTAGVYTITVTGTSGAITVIATVIVNVTTPPVPSFALTNSGAITISSPGAITGNTATITVTPSGGFTGSVALTAAIATSPIGATDLPTFSFGATTPVSITAAGAGTATLTVNTTAATSSPCNAANQEPRGIPWYAGGSAVLAGLFFFAIPARRRIARTMLGMLFLLAVFAGGVLACGGGGGTTCTPTTTPGTTAGSYSITVTGTSGALTETGTVTLTVQ